MKRLFQSFFNSDCYVKSKSRFLNIEANALDNLSRNTGLMSKSVISVKISYCNLRKIFEI
jgi:hypothetical protein